MQSAALMAQGALLTNMVSLLQRCLSATLRTGTVAEGERNVDASVAVVATVTPPPGPTPQNIIIDLDLGGDADKDDEGDADEDDEDLSFKDHCIQGDDTNDDHEEEEGPALIGRSGRVASSSATPSAKPDQSSEKEAVEGAVGDASEGEKQKGALEGAVQSSSAEPSGIPLNPISPTSSPTNSDQQPISSVFKAKSTQTSTSSTINPKEPQKMDLSSFEDLSYEDPTTSPLTKQPECF